MRPPGTASVEEHPKGSGKYRVSARIDGRLRTIRSNLSEGEALEIADAYAIVRDDSVVREWITLAVFAWSRSPDSNRRPTVYESGTSNNDSADVGLLSFPPGNLITRGDLARLALGYAALRMGVLPEGRAA